MEAPEIIDLLERDLTAKGAVRQWTSLAGALQEGAGIVCSLGEWPRSRSTAHQAVHASWVVSISCCTGAHKSAPLVTPLVTRHIVQQVTTPRSQASDP